MDHLTLRSSLLALAAAAALAGCNAPTAPPAEAGAAGQGAPADSWLQGSVDERLETLAGQLGGFGTAMLAVDHRYAELYFAGQDGSWDYAEHQVEEIETVLEAAVQRRPERAGNAAMLEPALEAVEEAIEARDPAAFDQAFGRLTATCNTCHAAEKVGFIRVATPERRRSSIRPAGDTARDRAGSDLARAQAAASAFSGRLQQRLQDALAEGGPVAAVGVCHADAPLIAAAVMAEQDVRLGRVAAPGRNRNPAHAAADWRLETLRQFQQAVDEGAAAADQVAVIREGLPEGVALRMMRGIETREGCLACHGDAVAPDVREAIAARYPDDGATGFAVGDLRGALWVEVPARRP